jgi:LuxR family maltose regulon positive regulatory protein
MELSRKSTVPVTFTLAEAGELFTAAGVELDEPTLAVLHERTEGWAAVRRLLLRTSILERVSGELADLLTGDQGGERVLQDLEAAGAFVVSLDAARSWFRYHQLFAALLRRELRRTEPGAVTRLHAAAAGGLAAQGFRGGGGPARPGSRRLGAGRGGRGGAA